MRHPHGLRAAAGRSTFNPREYFDVKLYTGNGSTQTISGLGFSPDLVWAKIRNTTGNHSLYDIVRGATQRLSSSTTNAEATFTGSLTSFDSSGFSLGSNPDSDVNASGSTYAAWCWDAGSSTVTNTQGSISSQVRANASAGFSIATLTTPASGTFTVGHSLNVAPDLVICKARNASFGWIVYHRSAGAGNLLVLNSTAASAASTTVWQNTNPSSTIVFGDVTNWGTADYVMYSFAPVAGYSSFGSYTGNGSATGPVISGLGFQPYFVMIKASSRTGDWWMYDAVRSVANPRTNTLKANLSASEDTAGEDIDFQSDGFQIKNTDTGLNESAATYIYAAFA